jgi:hypothetical protein
MSEYSLSKIEADLVLYTKAVEPYEDAKNSSDFEPRAHKNIIGHQKQRQEKKAAHLRHASGGI